MLKFLNNTLIYLFKGNAFRNRVEDENAPYDEGDVEDYKYKSYDRAKDLKGNIFFKIKNRMR